MTKANVDVKRYAKEKKIPMWAVGECLNPPKNETAMSRWLRHELSESEKKEFKNAVDAAEEKYR